MQNELVLSSFRVFRVRFKVSILGKGMAKKNIECGFDGVREAFLAARWGHHPLCRQGTYRWRDHNTISAAKFVIAGAQLFNAKIRHCVRLDPSECSTTHTLGYPCYLMTTPYAIRLLESPSPGLGVHSCRAVLSATPRKSPALKERDKGLLGSAICIGT